mgnify:CR=1 FL=1
MNIKEEAARIVDLYNTNKSNLEFTLYVSRLENTQPDLFREIMSLLASGNFDIKYLNSTGQ